MMRVPLAIAISLVLCSVANAESRHGLGAGFSTLTLNSDDARRFGVQLASLGYGFHALGDPIGLFTAVDVLLPLRATQEGNAFNVASTYDRSYGMELVVAATHPLELGPSWSALAGAGVHLQAFSLNDALLRDFEHAAAGAVLVFGTRRRSGGRWLGGELGWNARLDLSADPVDLARGGDLGWALAAKVTLALEIAYDTD